MIIRRVGLRLLADAYYLCSPGLGSRGSDRPPEATSSRRVITVEMHVGSRQQAGWRNKFPRSGRYSLIAALGNPWELRAVVSYHVALRCSGGLRLAPFRRRRASLSVAKPQGLPRP